MAHHSFGDFEKFGRKLLDKAQTAIVSFKERRQLEEYERTSRLQILFTPRDDAGYTIQDALQPLLDKLRVAESLAMPAEVYSIHSPASRGVVQGVERLLTDGLLEGAHIWEVAQHSQKLSGREQVSAAIKTTTAARQAELEAATDSPQNEDEGELKTVQLEDLDPVVLGRAWILLSLNTHSFAVAWECVKDVLPAYYQPTALACQPFCSAALAELSRLNFEFHPISDQPLFTAPLPEPPTDEPMSTTVHSYTEPNEDDAIAARDVTSSVTQPKSASASRTKKKKKQQRELPAANSAVELTAADWETVAQDELQHYESVYEKLIDREARVRKAEEELESQRRLLQMRQNSVDEQEKSLQREVTIVSHLMNELRARPRGLQPVEADNLRRVLRLLPQVEAPQTAAFVQTDPEPVPLHSSVGVETDTAETNDTAVNTEPVVVEHKERDLREDATVKDDLPVPAEDAPLGTGEQHSENGTDDGSDELNGHPRQLALSHGEYLKLVLRMQSEIECEDVVARKKRHHNCFLGFEAMQWLLKDLDCTRDEAIAIAAQMGIKGLLANGEMAAEEGWAAERGPAEGSLGPASVFRPDDTVFHFCSNSYIALLEEMRAAVQLAEVTIHRHTYKDCLVGSEVATWFIQNGCAADRRSATALCNSLERRGLLRSYDGAANHTMVVGDDTVYRASWETQSGAHPLHDVVCEGWLDRRLLLQGLASVRQGRANFRRRYFVLAHGGQLLYYTTKENRERGEAPKAVLNIGQCTLAPSPERQSGWIIRDPLGTGETYELAADTGANARDWQKALRAFAREPAQ
eukprot:TRINITY_DN29412_c0_g1_i1.p1 TRINITY_DN29412_c0_g1~~TRINITY_DN29412_c0_g1_i1.p1  ORF type:complete len:807 (-),score=149.68 TRINITY_DN29412_c0_g1_i1:97-2517(-)